VSRDQIVRVDKSACIEDLCFNRNVRYDLPDCWLLCLVVSQILFWSVSLPQALKVHGVHGGSCSTPKVVFFFKSETISLLLSMLSI